jgi:hypothetical protein
MSYKYIDPVSQGYERVYLTKKKHNELFEYRKLRFPYRYEYYLSDETFIMRKYMNRFGIFLNIILFPIVILLNGFKSIDEMRKEYHQLFHQKETGSFSEDCVYKGSKRFNDILKNITR